MIKFTYSTELKKDFGDFGRNDALVEGDYIRLHPDVDSIRKIIESDEFEKLFYELLAVTKVGKPSIKEYALDNGNVLYVAPSYAKEYNMAAQVALAKLMGKEFIYAGIFHEKYALMLADLCEKASLGVKLMLSRNVAQNKEVVEKLEQRGVSYDATRCVQFFDTPDDYEGNPIFYDPAMHTIQENPNYGPYPRPAITGVFAGIYGMDLMAQMDHMPEACVVPIDAGIEAIGAFKAMMTTDCTLATYEDPICQEYHLLNNNCYTISVRHANEEKPNTIYCPEMVNWWRQAKVMRLGCDRIAVLDTSVLDGLPLSYRAKRAAVLAYEAIGCKELMVLEVEE